MKKTFVFIAALFLSFAAKSQTDFEIHCNAVMTIQNETDTTFANGSFWFIQKDGYLLGESVKPAETIVFLKTEFVSETETANGKMRVYNAPKEKQVVIYSTEKKDLYLMAEDLVVYFFNSK